MKYWFLIIIILFLVLIPAFVWSPVFRFGVLENIKKSEPINIFLVGDIMLDRGVNRSVNSNYQGNWSSFLSDLDYLKQADLVFGNLEGPISNFGNDLGNLYSFRMNPITLPLLADLGFKVLSVANNHAGDWGRVAFEDTLVNLQKYNILAVGGGLDYKQASQVKILEVKDSKIGFLAFSDVGPGWLEAGDNLSGITLASDNQLAFHIKQASNQVDVLIVSFHFGEEYQPRSNNRQQYLAKLAIDNGALIVVGHHPHVVQEIEEYNGGLIAYSLGNFIFDQYFSKETMTGLVLSIVLKEGKIDSYQLIESVQDSTFKPSLILN